MKSVLLCLVGFMVVLSSAADTATDGNTSPASTTVTVPSTTSVEQMCGARTDCDHCVKSAQCFWCKDKADAEACIAYPSGHVLPPSGVCSLDQARWGVCWLNYKALLISMCVIGGVLLISFCVCCYCCCCRTNKRKQQKRFAEEDASYAREREERQARSDERKSERRSKYDEIRRKYGLIKEDAPYQKFENETA